MDILFSDDGFQKEMEGYIFHSSIYDSFDLGFSEDSYESMSSEGPLLCSLDMLITKKRKRKRRRAPDYIPRVVKHDIRRFYGRMLMNVLNSRDNGTLYDFFSTYSASPLNITLSRSSPSYILSIVQFIPQFVYQGIQKIVQFFAAMGALNPDHSVCLRETEITTRNNLLIQQHQHNNNSTYTQQSSAFLSSKIIEDPVEYYRQVTGIRLPLLSRPIEVQVDGEFTLTIDDEKKISMLNMQVVNFVRKEHMKE